MTLATMQRASLDAAAADVHGRIVRESVELDGMTVTRVTFGPGARWSQDLKHDAGTELCEMPHVAIVLSGTLHVEMGDGSVQDFTKNDVMMIPPGHDAWSVGDQGCVFVEFSRGTDYYADSTDVHGSGRRS
jgi:quercetin dioxygenase-like cupin family protein